MSSSNSTTVYDDDAHLEMAINMPLPDDDNNAAAPAIDVRRTTFASPLGSRITPDTQLPSPPSTLRASRRRKRRASSFDIFVDPNAASAPPAKKSTARKDGRVPLGERKDFGNAAPRPPTTQTSYIPSSEDWNRYAHRYTPPVTPANPRPANPRPANPRPANPRPANPRPAEHRTTTPASPARAPTQPKNLKLYRFLEMQDWKATTAEIRAAYRKVALKYHPDKVRSDMPQMTKDANHERMILITAARDVLVDKKARAKYHKDGKLPLVFHNMSDTMRGNVV